MLLVHSTHTHTHTHTSDNQKHKSYSMAFFNAPCYLYAYAILVFGMTSNPARESARSEQDRALQRAHASATALTEAGARRKHERSRG
jgi:hypothetical protein